MKQNKQKHYLLQDVNKLIENNPLKLVRDAESKYRGQLFKLVKKILSTKRNKIVLLAGPSCAGKTTTARLLKEILQIHNRHIITISMDDFFLNRDETPKLPNGSYDFDSINALNLDQLETCFTTLFTKGRAKFPHFDFIAGKNKPGVFEYTLRNNTIVLFEGLHVLNPELTRRLGTDKFYKVYAHPETTFKSDDFELSPRNLRLVRRIIRDAERRGHTPEHTLKMWGDVVAAENVYIEPFKQDADFLVNTTHAYELGVYKKELYALLFNHEEAIRQLSFLDIFDSVNNLSKKHIPDTSLMWEFVDKD